MPPAPRCRLYLITPPAFRELRNFLYALDDALDGGDVASIQVRLKGRDGRPAEDDHIRLVTQLVMKHAHRKDVAVIVNDRPDIAAETGADGVHIGQGDAPYAKARDLVGPGGIVGVTCHDSRHLALEAGEAGADYVAFGAFYPTETKDAATRAEPELLDWWQQMIEIPCVAIGGIKIDNARPLVQAGADFLAVSAGVWTHEDGPGAAVAAFNALFDELATEK